MKIRIQTDTVEVPLPYGNFERYLFSEERHVKTQADEKASIHTYLIEKEEQVLARFRLFETDFGASSPRKATFGGIEFDDQLDVDSIQKLVHSVVENTPISIRITLPPQAYSPMRDSKIRYILSNNGFKEEVNDLNQHLLIDEEPFINHIRPAERRRLRKCREAGFVFEKWENPDITFIHQFVSNQRFLKSRLMNISLSALERLFDKMPEDFIVFRVKDGDQTIALMIGVRINSRILYSFIPADHPDYRQYSPTVMLYEGVYDYSQTNGYEVFDMGLSTDDGVPNEGLMRFKRNLGAIPSRRSTFFLDRN